MKGRVSVYMVAIWLWVAGPVSASTVVGMDIQQVVDTAELVFEGTVLSVESRQTGPRRIHTFVRFRVLDVIKGDFAGDELELRYLGGEVNGRRMQVTDMSWPGPGESGVYFVESLQRPLVHPLVGWSQGHYRIETDAQGEARVFTSDRRPVAGLSAPAGDDRSEPVSRPQAATPQLGHGDSAAGLSVRGLSEPQSAMRAGEFKSRVRDLVDEAARAQETGQ